jgi:lauroyl/myristoyl acyltransferase
MVDNVEQAALYFAGLYRYVRSTLLAQTVIDPRVEAELQRPRANKQGAIILVPHCAGAVLSSAKLSTVCPTVLLVREPKDPVRCRLFLEYIKKLGPEFILVRNMSPALVIRNIVRALREGKVVVGTTDLVKVEDEDDTVPTQAFEQQIYSVAGAAFGTAERADRSRLHSHGGASNHIACG